MKLSYLSKPIALCIALAMPMQIHAMDLNLSFDESSALTQLTDSDWKILKEAARNALNNSHDGSSHVWKNVESSNAGVITILSTDSTGDARCRDARFINTAGDLTSTTFVTLCSQRDKWVEHSLRSTTTTEASAEPTTSLSVMLDHEPEPSTEITNKIISETSERCQQLAKNIENLKGKPLRQSVARDVYGEECLTERQDVIK